MLATQELITEDQAGSIIQALEDLDKDGQDQFTTKPGYGTINLQIEEYLSQRLGQDTAGRLPIGRSRIDHGATVRRVSDRCNVLKVQRGLLVLQEALIETAERHGDSAIISFTHMQQAQPATFGHYLLAFYNRLGDSFQQLSQGYDRLNRSPLGAVGLSGTELPIDRKLTASLLGFPATVGNSLTGRDAYYQTEIAFALALIMTVLNDLCTDFHIQSATEFGYLELDDSHCSTSSIFPQKKNPVALEAVKLVAAEAHGWVAAALAIFRNEGTADQYYRSVPFLPNACTSTANMLCLTAEIVRGITVNKARCEEQLAKAWVTTSRLGNTLCLRHGADFRTAHSVVGRLVKICLARGKAPNEVTVELLQDAATEMGLSGIDISQEELSSALDYRKFLQECNSAGGVGQREFGRLLELAKDQNTEDKSWVEGKERRLAVASMEMDKATRKLKGAVAKVEVLSV
ncbi:L-Aspartase-like protein [Aspergillus cavernicola]|uniref:Arginosuccinase n=1 Tax=Aspergillus cavernicola TaxID=176166 RepID=A0ABR4I0M9_9EURO